MSDVLLTRFAYSPHGTFGQFSLKDGTTLFTCERPWLNNQPNISCIPEGSYECRPREYRRGGYPAIEVCNVPNRSAILWHVGNNMHDSEGCILPGGGLGCVNGIWAVTASQKAFDAFMSDYGDGFNLRIDHARFN